MFARPGAAGHPAAGACAARRVFAPIGAGGSAGCVAPVPPGASRHNIRAMLMQSQFDVAVPGPGLHEITRDVQAVVSEAARRVPTGGRADGLATVFIPHTSASVVIQENADPAVLRDLQTFLQRLAPEGEAWHTHVEEGPDDMPAHIRGALLPTSLSIPVVAGRLSLGRWQGVFLWEHRLRRPIRQIIVAVAVEG